MWRRLQSSQLCNGLDAEIVVGENQCIPYPPNSFDLLLSANVIHYEHSEEGMKNSILEYARVLRRSGRLLMLTTHPENWLLKGCSWLGKHLARVNNPEDFRNGEILFVFQNEAELKDYFSEQFADIKVGINQLDLFKKKIISFVITGRKC
jgi:SAM-dependent methyltransferase